MAARLCTVDGRRSRQLERPWTSTGRDEALHPTSTGTWASEAAANSAEYCDAGDRYANHGASDACVDGPSNGPGSAVGRAWGGLAGAGAAPRASPPSGALGEWLGWRWRPAGAAWGRARGLGGRPGRPPEATLFACFCSSVRPCMRVWVPGRRPGVPLRCPHRWPAGECAGGVVWIFFDLIQPNVMFPSICNNL